MTELIEKSSRNGDIEEIDFITSIAYLWRLRSYFISGLIIGGLIAFFVGLSVLRKKAEMITLEVFLSPSSVEMDGVIPPVEAIDKLLSDVQGKQIFFDVLESQLAPTSSTVGLEHSNANISIRGLEYEPDKSLKVTLTINATEYNPSLPESVSAAVNEVVRVRNESIQSHLLSLEDQLYESTEKFSKASFNLMRLAQDSVGRNDPLMPIILEAVVSEGMSIRAIDKMFLLISAIPDSNPKKAEFFSDYRQALRQASHARDLLDAARSTLNPQTSPQKWIGFEFRKHANTSLANQSSFKERMFKLILVGLIAGGLLGSVLGSAYIYWRIHQKRLQVIFRNSISQEIT